MSAEHVAAMNYLLDRSSDVRAACATLSRTLVMAHRLAGGPGGATVHWTTTLGATVHFSLEPSESPDLTFFAQWDRMIEVSRAQREGRQLEPGGTVEGDIGVLALIAPVLEVARRVATLPVEFPEV